MTRHLIITYDPVDGTPVADGKVVETAEEIVKHMKFRVTSSPVELSYSTDNIFMYLRWMVVTDQISHEDITIMFKGQKVPMNRYAAIHDWPDGFTEFSSVLAEKILDAALKKRRRERATY